MAVRANMKTDAIIGRLDPVDLGDRKQADVIARSEDCYACHAAHGAVDNTFVQFYPTLLGLAAARNTLAPGYLEQK